MIPNCSELLVLVLFFKQFKGRCFWFLFDETMDVSYGWAAQAIVAMFSEPRYEDSGVGGV